MKQVSLHAIKGTIKAPASKSMMQRYVALSSLSISPTVIEHPSLCEDGLASLEVAKNLGATVHIQNNTVHITPSSHQEFLYPLPCAESGTSFRIFAAIAALFDKPITITGTGTLLKRPMKMIEETLTHCGVSVKSNNGFAPLTICGPITNHSIVVDGSESSQLLSGLLVACCCCDKDTTISVTNLKSKPYIDMTLRACREFGLEITASDDLSFFSIPAKQVPKCSSVTVEGDWSGASFLLVAGAIAGEVTVTNLLLDSLQADRAIMDALDKFGANVWYTKDGITVQKNKNFPFEFDATDCPDLFPPLAALAAAADGTSRIKGATRLIHKESNRARALTEEYGKLGIRIIQEDDYLIVDGGSPEGAVVTSHDDHRIAMSLAITALRSAETISIEKSECVRKSYPDFFSELESIYE